MSLDYTTVRLTEKDKADHIAQLDALAAFFYKEGLDRFGGLPIYTSALSPLAARATDQQTFNHIEGLLKNAITNLSKQTAGKAVDGYINQGVAAALLAQLYLNAEAYTGTARFADCAKVCEDIIAGVYGTYGVEDDWNIPYGFTNKTSKELIWAVPSDTSKRAASSFINYVYTNASFRTYFGLTAGSPWNGMQIQPSREHLAPHDLYLNTKSWKLGSPFAKFTDGDDRKKPFAWKGDNDWEGIFLMEELVNPITGGTVDDRGNAKAAIKIPTEHNENGVFVKEFPHVLKDYLTRPIISKVDGKDQLDGWFPSEVRNADAYSGYRMVKYPLVPMEDVKTLDGKTLPGMAATRFDAYVPVIRMPEVVYMLAECKMRAGDKAGAATLINGVRKRYFEGGADPNPVTAANLDDYRMLDEWLIEFIDEGCGRRRTDLIRFDKFVTEDWWDHKASNNHNLERFPIPDGIMTANPLFEQNPQ